MGSHSPCVPCLALYLLWLLFPPPVLRARPVRYHDPPWRLFRHLSKGSRSFPSHLVPGPWRWHPEPQQRECQGVFNLYLILEKSGSVDSNWIHVCSFVEELVKKFPNPDLQMSFITYSNYADLVMPLTSDRTEIHKGLNRLQRVVPGGHRSMQKGFQMANEQIQTAQKGGKHVASMIIALTDGILFPDIFQETVNEANRARDMGAVIYTVGVFDSSRDQMTQVADSTEHLIGVNHGFRGLHDIVSELSHRTCMEATSVEPSTVCAGETYKVDITGHGFHNTRGQDQVICRFKFSDSHIIDERVLSMTDSSITCPGPMIEQPGQKISVEISLSNGAAFLGSQLSISSMSCMRARGRPIPKKMFLVLLAPLLLLPLLVWCIWRCCCKKTAKGPPPPPPPPEPESDRCNNYTVLNPSCTQACSPEICLAPLRECFHVTQTPCRPRIVLQPGGEYYQVRKAPGCSETCFRASPDCTPVAQTVYTPRMCPQSAQKCPSLHCYSQCQHFPSRCTRCRSRMLPLLSPNARQPADSLYQPCWPAYKLPKS